MTTYWRALCADLADALSNAIRVIHHEDGTMHISTAEPVLDRARAALAEPEPKGPTDSELWELGNDDFRTSCWPSDGIAFARAVLARFGGRQ